MTKEEYEKMRSKKENRIVLDRAAQVTATHINKMKNCVGNYRNLARITNFQECALRNWRRGVKMKATTAMLFEKRFNNFMDEMQEENKSTFRCDRKKLIYYFFDDIE